MVRIYEIKLVTSEGYAVRRVHAPSLADVVEELNRRDASDLAGDSVEELVVKRVRL